MTKHFILLFLFSVHSQAATSNQTDLDRDFLTSDGTVLKAKMRMPEGSPRGILLILSGSGNAAHDGDVSSPLIGYGFRGQQAKLNEQIAETAARLGFASFRYSKRGVDDPAQAAKQVIPVLKQDAIEAVDLLKRELSSSPIAIVGFSEGALIATLVAAERPVDSLFLLGLPTRSIDAVLEYQFREWPRRKLLGLDRNHDLALSPEELSIEGAAVKFSMLGLSLTGPADPTIVDVDHDGRYSIPHELLPAYEGSFRQGVMGLMKGPLREWYETFRALPPFSDVARKISAKSVFVYHAKEDAQVSWEWIAEDVALFPTKPQTRLFEGLGHCFSPMEGAAGEIRTSGPIQSQVLEALGRDLDSAFPKPHQVLPSMLDKHKDAQTGESSHSL